MKLRAKYLIYCLLYVAHTSHLQAGIKNEPCHRKETSENAVSTNKVLCSLTTIYNSTQKQQVDEEDLTELTKAPSANSGNNNNDDPIKFNKKIPSIPEKLPLSPEPHAFKVNFSGYVKPEFFWDSRQTIGNRNDQILIYPEPKELDRCGRDIQAHPVYTMLAIESRVRAEIIGPDVLGAAAKGVIEADFYGINEQTCNVFRMRHAYTQLDWKNYSLLFGQYWHPLYTPECSPDTIEGNAGAPMEPYKRGPQARFTRRFDPFEISIAALSEVHFNSDGPIGGSCDYLRNAVIPDLAVNLQGKFHTHLYGLAVGAKRLVPRLKSDLNLKVDESIYSGAFSAYVRFNWETFILKLKATLAQNGADLSLLGGYAVHSIQPDSDMRTYANLQSLAVWADFSRANSSIEPGCFIGMAKNIGSSQTIIPAIKKNKELHHLTYGFGTEFVDYVFRIQPRVRWFFKPVVFGLELDYTQASYGQPNRRAHIADRISYLHPVDHPVNPGTTSNTRILFTALYYF